MGVHHLWQLLDEHGVGEQCNMQSMRGQTVAIDFSGWAVATDMLANHQELGNHPVLRLGYSQLVKVGLQIKVCSNSAIPRVYCFAVGHLLAL